MALVLADRIKESTTVTSTGPATLLGAATGFQAFSVLGNGSTTYYCISDLIGANWEVGLGTYSTTGPTLTRTTILSSSNAGSAVNFGAGTKDVFVTIPAGKGVWTDSSNNVTLPAALTITGNLSATTKSFLIDHPTKDGMKLRYGSLESPYHGVRLTGESEIVNGTCTVNLPDYIHGLCKQEGSQVQITNIKHGKVIWVDDINVDEDYFIVKSDTLVHDDSEYNFYWSFTAIRKDIEEMIVEYY